MSGISGNVGIWGAYSGQGMFTSGGAKNQTGVSFGQSASVSEKKRMLASGKNESAVSGTTSGSSSVAMKSSGIESILQSTKQYSASLQTQRQQSSSTANKIKKLKYQFKNISSQIIRSKTSNAARQAASQARREYLRLKRESQSGEYDSDELEAAITHAKAMERVAKKKAKHLEEEEMAKAAGGVCADTQVDDTKSDELGADEDSKSEDIDFTDDAVEYEYEQTGEMAEQSLDLEDMPSGGIDDIVMQMSSISEFSKDMEDVMNESMKEMLDDMGLDELTESLEGYKRDLDPQELDAMKIKHRNKEMKEIVKADSEYLKALFDHYEKEKGSSAIPGMSSSAASSVSIGSSVNVSAADIVASSGEAAAIASPTIDVSL